MTEPGYDPASSPSALTRARLIATAEKLFAERGIDAVSLAEINLAAGQRNKTAAHYHFGDKNGLLRAVLDKHLPALIAARNAALDRLSLNGGWTVPGVIRAVLDPLASKLDDADGGREFVRISAQLASHYAQALGGRPVELFPAGLFEPLRAARDAFLTHLPEPVAQQRVSLAISMILHGMAEHATGDGADTALFLCNLEDCLVAMCEAPMSPRSRESLA